MRSRPVEDAAPAKLSAPRLGRSIHRPRLFGLLDAAAHAPGLWICAPPGAGKTTLAAGWLARRTEPALWLQLDADDADPATFVRSLDALCARLAEPAAALPPFRGEDLADLPGWMRRRLRRQLPRLPPRWTLALDNVHALPAASPLHAALAAALAELPLGVQWLFASREPPPPFARPLAHRQLLLLEAEALRLDEDESLALLRLHGHGDAMLAPVAVARGWAAGITLMALSQPPGAPLPAQLLRERLFDYFADEVMAQMPAADQALLAQLAFLPSVTPALAQALCGGEQAQRLLERLAAAGLFIDRRGEPAQAWVLHELFREFLRRRHERTQAPDAVRALRQRCGELLLQAGDADAGLQCLIEARAWDRAGAGIAAWAARYIDGGRALALLRHLEALPADAVAPWVLWRGLCRLETDPAAAVADLVQAQAQAQAAGDGWLQLEAAAGAAAALLSLGRLAELAPWLAVLDAHQALLAPAPLEASREMRLVPPLFSALVHHRPWHPLVEPLAERAERLLHAPSAAAQRLLLGALAFHFLWRGQPERLARIVARVDALADPELDAPLTLVRWWSLGVMVKSFVGQLAAARADAQRMLDLVEAEPVLAGQRANAELLAVLVAIAARDVAAVRLHLARGAAALHPDRAIDRSFCEHEQAMLALLEDDAATALRLMPAAVASGRASGFVVREHIALIGHALAAACCDEHGPAAELLQAVRAHPLYAVCTWHHWIAGCVAAYAAWRRGDADAAERELRAAFALARTCGYRGGPMLLAWRGLMPALVALALRRGIEPALARELVQRHRLEAPDGAGETWPWAVRIRSFGAFEIEIDGEPPPPPRKASRRLHELLRLLVAQAGAPLALEAAADALWPEAEGDAARNALDNALHRLRKLLGGDDRVLLRQGALLLNPQRCWTDAAACVAALPALERALVPAAGGGDAAAVAAALQPLLALCRGPWLASDDNPAVGARRAALQRRLGAALAAAASQLAAAGRAGEAQQALALSGRLIDPAA